MKSRKLWFFIGMIIMSTALLINAVIPPDTWEHVMTICAIGYAGGNVGEHFANRNE